MAKILTGARKYRLGLTLAHQELHQLQDDAKVASAVMTQPCTRIVLRVGDDDAKKLGDGFTDFDAKSLTRLEKFHAIARVERNDFDFNLSLRKPELETVSDAQVIIAASRAKYATPRAEVEAALLASLRGDVKKSESQEASEPRTSSHLVPTAPRTETAKVPPPSPSPVIPQGAEPPKAAEVPKPAASTPTAKKSPHTPIKDEIRAVAETLDYTVSLEEHFPMVQGRADMVLRRGRQTIVGQVSVTTPVEYEVASIQKFLRLKFTHLAVISINRKKLNQIQQALAETGSPAVEFYSPTEFISKLHDWALDDPEGATLERGKPRKRQISFDAAPLSDAERRQLEKELLESLKQAMKSK